MVGFHDIEQISEYTIDIDKVIEKNIIDSMDSIMSAMGGNKELLSPKEILFMVADYIEWDCKSMQYMWVFIANFGKKEEFFGKSDLLH